MDQSEDPKVLARKIEQASRIASALNDPTTVERLTTWAQGLRSRLQLVLDARRTNQEIRARAHELWEQNGRPGDRDLEFWLQAEAEIRDRNPDLRAEQERPLAIGFTAALFFNLRPSGYAEHRNFVID